MRHRSNCCSRAQDPLACRRHLLNTIALWDRPAVSDELTADGRLRFKAAIRADWVRTRSEYCSRAAAERLAALAPVSRADVERRLTAALCADRAEELDALAAILPGITDEAEAKGGARRALQLLRKLAHRKHARLFAAGAAAVRHVAAGAPRTAFLEHAIAALEELLRVRLGG